MTLRPPSTRILAPDQGLIILNCSREKLVTSAPVAALDLYQGACVPQARDHFAADPSRRARIRILSAAHGLLRPEKAISTYDHRLTNRVDAVRLHERTVSGQLDAELAETPSLRHLLIVVEPLYLLALQRVFDHLDRFDQIAVIPDPWGWWDGLTYLHQWGWA
ncbi:hypothetical protein SacmaDRAFT_0078 [Saccharomonospora marina XMU15]|uniref:DUF6884 domain-containing protein n=2 Tax=Pseudonocardiaceae TaxID=2070 RepID=A0A2N3X165_9PSEU|nr:MULTISPECIES: DUF6884 domain-containing protein [Pseudonocardiaceae]EHR48394.1 hypothetical protein SacmaDRAFT_0078 [Saccharomonospora marina XMU15]PKV99861.1 hypothetical protein ATK30_0850 [Amycolatopsis niigatensis]